MRTYLVVGGSSGIGLETSRQLLQAGNKVVVIGRNEPDLPVTFFHADVIADESLPAFEEHLDGLVYCPGSIKLKPFRNLSLSDFEEDLRINYLGLVKVLQQYHPALKRSAQASVVVFSTVAVKTGMPFHTSIAGAKAAVEGLARSLAAEWAPFIRVNVIAPSLTDTPMASRLLDTEAKREASAGRHPLKQVGDAKNTASLVTWLLGEDAVFMTGQVLRPDGGISSLKI